MTTISTLKHGLSTSFTSGGKAVPVSAIGNPHTSPQPFDEAMYALTTPLPVIPPAQANDAASSGGAQAVTGQDAGETHHAIRDD
jgi:hypothetical protein